MKRLCLVTETFPPEVNGVAMTLQRMCRGWVERGLEVMVVRPRQDADAARPPETRWREILVKGWPIPGYPEARAGAWSARRLRREWEAFRPDWVHVATEGLLGWSAQSAARRLGIPLVTSFHTNFHDYAEHYGAAWMRPLVARYLRSFHNRGRISLVPDARLREELGRLGIRRTGPMGRGVDCRLFDPARRDEALRRSWGAGPEDPVVVHVSRVAAEKNIPLVVRAWQAIRQELPTCRLVIVGDGPELPRLRRHCPEAVCTGMRFDEDLARHYASGDLFLFASSTETYGNVVMEAVASGLVVVAYDYAAARQHIRHGREGWTVPLGDEAAFLRTAVAAARTWTQADEMRRLAREAAARLPWDGVVEAYLGEVASVLGSDAAV